MGRTKYQRLGLRLQWLKRNGSHFAMPWISLTGKEVFDEMMFDIHRLYISQLGLLYAVQPERLSIKYLCQFCSTATSD
jgi:hypothetical protein